MSFSFRAAALVAAICATSLVVSSSPGLALEPNRDQLPTSFLTSSLLNVPESPSVPKLSPAILEIDQAVPTAPATIENDQPAARPTSLDAMIATQPMPETVDGDLACLAGAIYFEAKGEPLAGQLAVGKVILNRAKSGRFPKSACAVVTQPGQFSFVRGGRIPAVSRANTSFRTAVAVAQVAMTSGWASAADNALFFHARHVQPRWRLTRIASIGGHIFYR